jgi:hypothetical protein
MILKFDKFSGKVKDSLQKEEVIDLVSLITDMKPSLQQDFDNKDLSKLIDNINYYTSEDGRYNISVYFRESDIYRNSEGVITYGRFKSLFKITISKVSDKIKLGEVKDFLKTFYEILTTFFPSSVIWTKIREDRISVDDFSLLSEDLQVEDIKLIIRIV